MAGTCATLAACWRVTATDQTVLGFTTASEDLVISGITYRSMRGFTPTNIQTSSGLSVDNLDVKTALDMLGILFGDIRSGKWDFAEVQIFLVNYKDLSQGLMTLRRGRIGRISTGRNVADVEIRGLVEDLSKQLLELYSPGCRANVGDDRCKVRLDPPSWQANTVYAARISGQAEIGSVVKPLTPNGRHFVCIVAGTSGGSEPTWDITIGNTTVDGTVTWQAIQSLTVDGTVSSLSSAPKRVFRDSSRTEPDAFFDGGLLTWLKGSNAGQSMEVKKYTAANGEFELVLPMVSPITLSDTFRVHAGCFKRLIEDCQMKFDNIVNFRGEPFVPENFQVSPATINQNAGGK